MDIGSIQALISSLQAAGNIAQAMIGLRDAAVLNAKIAEFQAAILSAQGSALAAQSEQSTLIDRIRQLEAEVRRLEAWEAEKQRYQLSDVGHGMLAYTLKPDAQPPELTHTICANCYNRGEKSILQPETKAVGRTKVLACHHCGAELIISGMRQREHEPQVITKRPRS